MTNRRAILIGVAAVAVVGLIVTGATGVLQAGAKLGVSAIQGTKGSTPSPSKGPRTSRGAAERTPSPTPTRSSTPKPKSALAPVLPSASSKPIDAKKLKARIAGVHKPKHAGTIGAAVLDPSTGKTLYRKRAGKPMTPASTNKLLTSASALQRLGGQHRFQTKVVSDKSGQITLVGGGDPYLASKTHKKDPSRASLQELADATAQKLRAKKTKKVRLGYDASLFRGSGWNSHWHPSYHNQVSPITALWADEGRVSGESPGPRQHHPAKSAARTFAKYLKKQGVKTKAIGKTHPHHGKNKSKRQAQPVASVSSLPLTVIVERLLRASDNDAAEVIARQVAIADGKKASFGGGVSAIKHTLKKTGVWRSGTRMYDGSGLSRDDRVPPAMLAKIVHRAAGGHRHWGPLLAGLPVAGVEGSLGRQYTSSHARAGRGLVHAKTGTLRGVHSLAGYAYTRDGELVVFTLMANHSKQDFTTPIWLRRLTAAIASCGCSG